MAIAASGAVSFSDLRTEFVGGSGAVSFSDLYRGGSNIPAKAANNLGVNLAASVPASGTVNFTNFRNTTKGFRYTYTSGATNQNASALFGDDYSAAFLKEIVIESGVELGATSTADEALQIDAGGAGTITITNNGILTGAGGAANGGAGGDAFEANVACTFINNGTIRSGGGGAGRGGNGGTGGGGRYTSLQGSARYTSASSNGQYCSQISGRANCPTSHGGYAYSSIYTGSCRNARDEHRCSYNCYGRRNVNVNTNGGGGGSGGNGGVGQGYNQTNASGAGGSGGANGGTNAGRGGTGGTGGTGGLFGANGANGNNGATGNNGNRTGGSGGAGGSGGGAAGKSIRGISNVTLTNSGTITGPQL